MNAVIQNQGQLGSRGQSTVSVNSVSGNTFLEDEEKLKVITIQFGEKMNEMMGRKMEEDPSSYAYYSQVSLMLRSPFLTIQERKKCLGIGNKATLFSIPRNFLKHSILKLLHMDLPSSGSGILWQTLCLSSTLQAPQRGCQPLPPLLLRLSLRLYCQYKEKIVILVPLKAEMIFSSNLYLKLCQSELPFFLTLENNAVV